MHAITQGVPLFAESFVDVKGSLREEGWFPEEDGPRSSRGGGAGSTGDTGSAPSCRRRNTEDEVLHVNPAG